MWQEAKANDRRVKELMANHKRRAERRRAYHESRLGDPQQLLRVIGSSLKLYPDAEQFYYHENPENLMPWLGNPDIKIDRFDGRSLLDSVPEPVQGLKEDNEDTDELNFERYRDLIEAERLNINEADQLAQVEEEWTKLLDRHQAKLALIDKSSKESKTRSNAIGFDYGTTKVIEDDTKQQETLLIYEPDLLEHVDDLTEKDKEKLNAMSSKYGVKSYARLLRVAKKDRDAELKALKKKQDERKPKDPSAKKGRRKRKRRRRRYEDDDDRDSYRRLYSPSYEPYGNEDDEETSTSSGSMDSDEDNTSSDASDFIIEFGSNAPEEKNESTLVEKPQESVQTTQKSEQEKKLTPMEKLKLKMKAGLEKQIILDERSKRQKEREKEIEQLQELAKSQKLPVNSYMRPEPPSRPLQDRKERYRSPSSSPEKPPTRYRSPSTESERGRSPVQKAKERHRSPSSSKERTSKQRYRSPSTSKQRYRSPSSSRERTSKHRYRSPSSSRERASKQRYRSPSSSRERASKRRYRSPSSSKEKSYSTRRRSPSSPRFASSSHHRHRSRSRSHSPTRHQKRDRSRDRHSKRYRSPPKRSLYNSRRSPSRESSKYRYKRH
ncbi:alternative splicing regulator-domain-containing protein [Rhizopus microsporus]